MGLLPIKPAKVLLSYTGPDKRLKVRWKEVISEMWA
jgi:hypothetical protein